MILYQVLPETEGKTLEEIENFFSDKSRKLLDRHIKSIESTKQTHDDGIVNSKSGIKHIDAKPMDNPAFVEGA